MLYNYWTSKRLEISRWFLMWGVRSIILLPFFSSSPAGHDMVDECCQRRRIDMWAMIDLSSPGKCNGLFLSMFTFRGSQRTENRNGLRGGRSDLKHSYFFATDEAFFNVI